MDRFTIAGVLHDIQIYFKIADDDAGLLQTVFIVSYMIFAPLFGYLGDRYSRRWIMATGVLLWCSTMLIGSFMTKFGWFITFRALVGIGEASYSTIVPTIISDLYVDKLRSKMLAGYYFAMPVGSGLGYIVGSKMAHLANNWRWALRVTPILGIVAVFLIIFIKEPERGKIEGSHQLSPTTYSEDVKYLLRNRSFMFSTAGFTCVAFVAGALSLWAPKYIFLGFTMQSESGNVIQNEVSFKFGAITMVAGLLGVPLGSMLSQKLTKRFPNADPLICAFGLISSMPLLTGAMIIVSKTTIPTYVLIFFGQMTLNMNWAIFADILLYVVVPTRRATAEALQILISHTFGDAGSPYLVGILSEEIKIHLRTTTNTTAVNSALESPPLVLSDTVAYAENTIALTVMTTNMTVLPIDVTRSSEVLRYDVVEDTDMTKFKALQYALFLNSFVELLGGIFFLITATYVVKDRLNASQATQLGRSAKM